MHLSGKFQFFSHFFKVVLYYFFISRYYLSTISGFPGVRHLFRKSASYKNLEPEECLTCPGQQVFNVAACVESLFCEYSSG